VLLHVKQVARFRRPGVFRLGGNSTSREVLVLYVMCILLPSFVQKSVLHILTFFSPLLRNKKWERNLPLYLFGLAHRASQAPARGFLASNLISKCERRLVGTTTFLSQARRLELTNSVFFGSSNFFVCTFRLSKSVIEHTLINFANIACEGEQILTLTSLQK